MEFTIINRKSTTVLITCIVLFLFSLSNYAFAVQEDKFISLAEDVSCGEIRQFEKESRILGGVKTNIAEFPFLVSIQNLDGRHFCSAFIVKKQVLVTAAHCFLDALHGSSTYKTYQILVGSNDWTDTKNSTNLFKISQIRIHPEYSYLKPNVENDIALLTLDRPIQWSNQVQPICLASSELRNHDYGVIAGWGVRSHSQRQNSNEWMQDTNLYKVSLPIWTNKACQAEYRKHRINWNTKSSHICAGFQDRQQDTCQGDSGSPLVLLEDTGKRVAYGIVSIGEGCANKLPGMYHRVCRGAILAKWYVICNVPLYPCDLRLTPNYN